jgi:hypothetical protein
MASSYQGRRVPARVIIASKRGIVESVARTPALSTILEGSDANFPGLVGEQFKARGY